LTQVAIIYPLVAQVLLTFVLLFWTARLRYMDLSSNSVRPADIALREPNWPAKTTQVGNCYANQLELPVLFYVLVLLVVQTRMSDIVLVVLAWVFVLARLGHAYIHTTTNPPLTRGRVFGIGATALLIMWVWYAVKLLTASV
jgi:hypothetical protein